MITIESLARMASGQCETDTLFIKQLADFQDGDVTHSRCVLKWVDGRVHLLGTRCHLTQKDLSDMGGLQIEREKRPCGRTGRGRRLPHERKTATP